MKLSLPMMRCDDGCGECCGMVMAKEHEYQRVVAFAKAQGIEPRAQGITCPWYQDGKCAVYPVRPFVCQLFGHVPRLKCCKGYNVDVLPSLEKRLVKEYGKPTRFLHEVLPNWFATLCDSLVEEAKR